MTPDSHAPNSKASSWRVVAALGVVLLGGLAIHARSLGHGFFADDYLFLEQVRGRSLFAALVSPDPLGNFIRPLGRQAWFWFVSHTGHEAPFPFHLANLALFLGSVAMLYRLVRRLGGDATTAIAAAAFLAFHYAADVPVAWAAGAQDLLALLLAMAAIYAHVGGRRVLSAVSILAALLAKESVAPACLVAIAATRDRNEPWSRSIGKAGFMLATTAAWAVWWLVTATTNHMHGTPLAAQFGNLLAAPVHFVQSALGLEFRQAGSPFGHWNPAALWPGAVAAGAMWLSAATRVPQETVPGDARDRLTRTGVVWAAAGALPTVPVAGIWSAYFYVFALAGAGVLVGATTSSLSRGLRLAVVAALVCLSACARQLDEFSPTNGAWAWQSHVNRHYLDRAVSTIQGYLRDIKTARPTLPQRSVIFFADVPVSLGWQTADGPLVRWAYRDTTLRSYYLTQFSSERIDQRLPCFFAVEAGHLAEKPREEMLPALAYSMLVADKPAAALAALDILLSQPGGHGEWSYWRALARWATGDTVGAASDLDVARMRPVRASKSAESASARALPADTLARRESLVRLRAEAALDPWVHARLASLLLARSEQQQEGVVEAYAFRVLAPKDPDAWRKWASAQLAAQQYAPALHSLEMYVALAGDAGRADSEVQAVIQSLRRVLHGDVAHAALRSSAAGQAEVTAARPSFP